MRVLVVSHPAVLASNQAVYEAVQEQGHDVHLVTPHAWKHDYSANRLRPSPARGLASQRALRVVREGSVPLHAYVGRISATLRAVRPDVLYVEEEPYSIAAAQWVRAGRRAGVPTAFYCAQNIFKAYPSPVAAYERFVHRNASAVCISNDAVVVLRRRGFSGRAHVVPLSVDTKFFSPSAEKAGRRPVVGYVGRLVPAKGLHVLVDAQRLAAHFFEITIVGDGPMRSELEALPHVRVLGGKDSREMPDLYHEMDIVVVPSLSTPSWREQFGRTVLEAAACGLPVIASDSGELPHLLRSLDGPACAPEGNAVELARALDALLDGRSRVEVGLRMRARAEERFSVPAVATRLVGAFDALRKG